MDQTHCNEELASAIHRLPIHSQYVQVEASVSQDITAACVCTLKVDEGKG